MTVQELMSTNPEACVAEDSGAVAGEIMRRRRCGFVPVVESRAGGGVVGVVTDRDLLLCLVGTNQPASALKVAACMTRPAITVAPEAELEEAARLMETAAVHRLPVVSQNRLVGVLSLKDIALAAQRQWALAGPHVVERQMSDIVEAIAAAR